MPDGYLYQKVMQLLEEYKRREEAERKELIKELARSFRLTKKDVEMVLKELEQAQEIKVLRGGKWRKWRVEFIQAKTGLINLLGRWHRG